MVGSRTSAIREIPSVQGIKLNLRLHRIRPGQTSNFAIIPSTAAAGDIQADDTKAPVSHQTIQPRQLPRCNQAAAGVL
jgi:hypothetical protein